MQDYQWPYPIITRAFDARSHDKAELRELRERIEIFFEKEYHTNAVLMPSGRAAISFLLSYYNLNRAHTFFAPLWSSHCVWDVSTRLVNPSTTDVHGADVALVVHKWGVAESFKKPFDGIVIEDSVDSLFERPALFHNMGEFEIVSLPKIMGSYSGGLILCNDPAKKNQLLEKLTGDSALAGYQSRLRFIQAKDEIPGFERWEMNEHRNFDLDFNMLQNIVDNLDNIRINKEVIKERTEQVSKRFGLKGSRLPPLICFEAEEYNCTSSEVMVRHQNRSGFIDHPAYKKVFLLPVHFGVTDEFFRNLFESLSPRGK